MNRIREIRKRLKIKQADVAAKAGISQPYLCDLEYNRRDGTPETLTRIAEVLGVDVAELVKKTKAG